MDEGKSVLYALVHTTGDVLTSHCFAEGLLRQVPDAVVTVLRSSCAAVATKHLGADNVSITHCLAKGCLQQSLQ